MRFLTGGSLCHVAQGAVSKVRIRDKKVGGSAFNSKTKLFGIPLPSFGTRTANEVQRRSKHFYALKSIILDRVSPMFLDELKNEINILRQMDHPNVVRLHEVYASKKQIYMVLELCDGGDLYTRAPYSEREAARYTDQLLSAIQYLHDHGVVHRDLKFENVMFESSSEDAQIKVIDFGLSKKFLGAPKIMTEKCGTIYTMSPQVLQGVYSFKADLWAVGVMTFMLLVSLATNRDMLDIAPCTSCCGTFLIVMLLYF